MCVTESMCTSHRDERRRGIVDGPSSSLENDDGHYGPQAAFNENDG